MPKLLREATLSDVRINEPLKYSIFDKDQRLLLRSGYIVTMPGLGEKLIGRGCYIGEASEEQPDRAAPQPNAQPVAASVDAPQAKPEKAQSPFEQCGELIISVRRITRMLVQISDPIAEIRQQLEQRAQQLLSLLELDRDAVIAACLLLTDPNDSRSGQQVLGAALAAGLARDLNQDEASRHSLVLAGLTRDLGLLDFDKAHGKEKPLSPELEQCIHQHPKLSCELLQRQGIQDRTWLRLIAQHHERLDGSGYPARLQAHEIDPCAQLLGLSDCVAAMLLSNPRRMGLAAPLAWRELAAHKKIKFDEQHIGLMLRSIGIYPPGTLLRLASGETAVVKKSAAPGRKPLAFSFYDRDGITRSTAVARDCNVPEFDIVACVALENCQSEKLMLRKLWA